MSFKRPSLRLSLILYVLLPLVVAMGVVSYVAIHAFERQLEGRMEEDVELVARAVRYPVARALARDQPGSLNEALESVFSINRIYGAYVYDTEGNIIASMGQRIWEQERTQFRETLLEGERQGEYHRIGGQEVYSYLVPLVTSDGDSRGVLQITRHTSEMRGSIQRLRSYAVGLMFATMVLMVGLVLVGHRRAIGKYLDQLNKGMYEVSRGNRDYRVSLDGPQEIASLGQGLNSMLDSIVATEEALRESEELFRTLAEHALVGILLIQDGRYNYVNPTFAEYFGYEPEELVGRSPESLVDPRDRFRVRENFQKRLSEGDNEVHFTFRGITKNGERRLMEVYGSRVMHQGAAAIVSMALDITDRRRMQREILQVQEKERRRIGQDLHDGVASELSGTTMLVGAMEAQARDTCPELAEQLGEIKSLMKETSEGVRRVSRGLNPVSLEEGGLAEALQRLSSNATIPKEITCRLEIEGELPSLSVDRATHLYRIAQEAVNNARKYSKADQLTIRLCRDERHLLLIVSDNGQGFDPTQVDEEGMGLRTMRYRSELLGGSFSIDTGPEQGTVVRVRVPLD